MTVRPSPRRDVPPGLVLIATVVRYVLRSGTYQGLELVEAEGWVPTVRGTWHLGWQWRTWRMLLQDVVVGVPFAVLAATALLFSLAPLVLLIPDNSGLTAIGIVGTLGLLAIWLAIVVVVGAVVGVLSALWGRAAVVDDQGVFAAIATGVRLARRNSWDLVRVWLLAVGVAIVMGLITVAACLALLAVALAVAGAPAYYLYRHDNLVLALLYGIPVGLAIILIPLAVIRGFSEIFMADVWTLVYRELRPRPAALVQVA